MDITTFSALAEPTRLRIVELLMEGPLTVGEIADRLELRRPQASKHLRVLLDAGLVEVQAAANRRNYKRGWSRSKRSTHGSRAIGASGMNGSTLWRIICGSFGRKKTNKPNFRRNFHDEQNVDQS
ncbi:metalloregulator ArsR/SmtB family transcription factor [Paenibacillus sp. P26]|nr:metalloregulator ArsR/SmtB family transcription factor [Paenibacillus sp. P26]